MQSKRVKKSNLKQEVRLAMTKQREPEKKVKRQVRNDGTQRIQLQMLKDNRVKLINKMGHGHFELGKIADPQLLGPLSLTAMYEEEKEEDMLILIKGKGVPEIPITIIPFGEAWG